MNNNSISFFQVVANSGIVGITLWMAIFFISLIGLILGIISIATALRIKKNKFPIALKLLFCSSIATILTGAYGTISGYVATFAMLATTTGAAKAAVLKLSIKCANYNIIFAIAAVLLQLAFVIISLLIIEKKSKQLNMPALSSLTRIKQVPIFAYSLTVVSIVTIIGTCVALWAMKNKLLLKAGETMPTFQGVDYTILTKFCLICAFAGVVMTLILLISAFKNKKRAAHACD